MGIETPLSDKVLQTLWAFVVLNFAVVTKRIAEVVFCILEVEGFPKSSLLGSCSLCTDSSLSEISSASSSKISSVTFRLNDLIFLG